MERRPIASPPLRSRSSRAAMSPRRWVVTLLLTASSCTDEAGERELPSSDAGAPVDAVDGAFVDEPDAPVLEEPCNGRPWLCDRHYDQITYLATHGAAT